MPRRRLRHRDHADGAGNRCACASVKRRPIDEHLSDARLRERTRRYLPGPLMYAAAIGLALVHPWFSLAPYSPYALSWLLPIPE